MNAALPSGEGLPQGFGWAYMYGTRPTLFYLSEPIAEFQPSGNAWLVHTSMQRMSHELRTIRLVNRALAIRYCEAYARRWESRIRTDLSHLKTEKIGPIALPTIETRDGPPLPGWTSAQESARRRGRRYRASPRIG